MPDIWGAVILVLVFAAFVQGYSLIADTRPYFRKGCGECTTEAARVVEAAKQQRYNLEHDWDHQRGMGKDRFACPDPACRRNPSNR